MKNRELVFILIFLASCATEPQPLTAGKDACNFCQMPVADTRFGAEIITGKGKLYKFDDVGCMNNFRKNSLNSTEKITHMYAVIYTDSQKLLEVNQAIFLKSPALHTPMNSGVAAFESQDIATSFLQNFPGEILTWDQLQQKLN